MSFNARTLYELLPAIHRLRDAEQGGPLRDLLAVIVEQVAVLEEDLDQLYDDQFIETCADWVAPYIGALVGYRALHGVVPRVSSPRAEVANTIAYRRRKGTALMLEQLAADVTGWPSHAVEFFQNLATTQYMNHLRLASIWSCDLRDSAALERAGGAFDSHRHTIDVRNIDTGGGRYGIPNIGLFLWRLGAFPLHRAVPVRVDARRFRFNPLGADQPLFTHPRTETAISHLATPLNVPAPISRRMMAANPAAYYGPGLSLLVEQRTGGGGFAPVAVQDIDVCNLADRPGDVWSAAPRAAVVAIDPELGRLLFRDDQPAGSVRVTFHYGFSAAIGGGEYERGDTVAPAGVPPVRVPSAGFPTISSALTAVRDTGGIIEVTNSGTYMETPVLRVPQHRSLILRAANGARPVLRLGGDLAVRITGAEGDATVTLDGLVVAGGAVTLAAGSAEGLRSLTLRNCTLVPGRILTPDGQPGSSAPSVVASIGPTTLVLDNAIVGPIVMNAPATIELEATDSVIDATSIGGFALPGPGGVLTLRSTTVVGRVSAAAVTLISDCIIQAEAPAGTAPVRAARVQAGCVRFSYLPPGALVPARYRCQPETEVAAEIERREQERGAKLSEAEAGAVRTQVAAWLVPGFTSLRYGQPGYGQLARFCPVQIRAGAEDEGEQGAFYSLFSGQRETNLRVRLDEYLKVGLAAGIFFET